MYQEKHHICYCLSEERMRMTALESPDFFVGYMNLVRLRPHLTALEQKYSED
jgi:hypothetical protein